SVPTNHRRESDKIDRPVAGLLRDLRQRGLLDDTLVIFNTEFGRTPYAESAGDQAGPGRDHNPDAFSVWLAGAGLKHGIAYGTSIRFTTRPSSFFYVAVPPSSSRRGFPSPRGVRNRVGP